MPGTRTSALITRRITLDKPPHLVMHFGMTGVLQSLNSRSWSKEWPMLTIDKPQDGFISEAPRQHTRTITKNSRTRTAPNGLPSSGSSILRRMTTPRSRLPSQMLGASVESDSSTVLGPTSAHARRSRRTGQIQSLTQIGSQRITCAAR